MIPPVSHVLSMTIIATGTMYPGGFLFDTPITIAATEEHVCTPVVSIVFDTLNHDYSKSGTVSTLGIITCDVDDDYTDWCISRYDQS